MQLSNDFLLLAMNILDGEAAFFPTQADGGEGLLEPGSHCGIREPEKPFHLLDVSPRFEEHFENRSVRLWDIDETASREMPRNFRSTIRALKAGDFQSASTGRAALGKRGIRSVLHEVSMAHNF